MTDAMQAGGLIWKGIMPWHKPAHRRIQGGVSYACEYAVVGCNGPVDQSGPQIDGFYSESAPSSRDHQTQKPVGLMRHCLGLARPGSVILDPFAGSATTGVAARMLGHRFVGIELSEHYFGVSCGRMAEVEGGSQAMQPSLFSKR